MYFVSVLPQAANPKGRSLLKKNQSKKATVLIPVYSKMMMGNFICTLVVSGADSCKEGTTINIGQDETDSNRLEIRFTPGHSPGSVCFYHEPGRFVIGGDVLFNGSIGRTDLPDGDFNTLINSIQTQLFSLPDETKVYSGHGPMTTVGFEKMNNPFVKLY